MTLDELLQVYPQMLRIEGLDSCIIGVAHRNGSPPVALYSRALVIGVFLDAGMSDEQANEAFEHRVMTADHGPLTPVFADLLSDEFV